MPVVDLVQLLDDLWFGHPNWYLPYVDDEEPGIGADVAALSRGLSVSHASASTWERNTEPRAEALGTSWNFGWFSVPFRGSKDRQPSTPANMIADDPEMQVTVSESSETSDPGASQSDMSHPFGTWAQRQTNFNLASTSDTSTPCNTGSITIRNKELPPAQRRPPRRSSTTDGEDADKKLREKAWEWRFRQRWAKEHNVDPYAKDVQEDDGLAFMTQHGEHGWHQQFRMESGSQRGRSVQTSFSGEMLFGMLHTPTPTPDNNSHLLRGPKEPPSTANGEATQKIIVAARQANELLMRQAKIDAEVKERWQACKSEGMLWAGKHLATSLFDMWGEIPYYLVKVADNKDHKFIVRAKHGLLSQKTVCQSVRNEIQEISDENGLPCHSIQVSVLGSGLMRWNDDACVCIRPSNGSLSLTALDAGGLVASLLRETVAVKIEIPEDFSAETGTAAGNVKNNVPRGAFMSSKTPVPQTS